MALVIFIFLITMVPTIGIYYFLYLGIALMIYFFKISLNLIVHISNVFPIFMIYEFMFNKKLFPKLIDFSISQFSIPYIYSLKNLNEVSRLFMDIKTKNIPADFLFILFFKKIS